MEKFTLDTNLPKNLPLLLRERVIEEPEINIQAARNKEGKFVYYSYQFFYEQVITAALAFKRIGVKRGDNIALISDNRREWLITDFALQSLGAADVPRGCDSMGNEIRFIIAFADCKTGVFENFKQLQKVIEGKSKVPLLKTAILFDAPDGEQIRFAKAYGIEVISFEKLMSIGREIYEEKPLKGKEEIEREMFKTEPDDTATIIFTSGTTGCPKGVMLTHRNYMSQLSAVHNFINCKTGDWWMTVLPVWHSFERLIQYAAIFLSCGLAYSKPAAPIMLPDMAEIRPQWMSGVPRLWSALAKGVEQKMKKSGGLTYALFRFFVNTGKVYAAQKDKVLGNVCQLKKRIRFFDWLTGIVPFIFLWPLHKLGDKLVFAKIRAKFGGRLRIAISGGGSLQKDVDDFYRAIGLELLEGYGLTETAPIISFRYYKKPRPGCVGRIFPTMELKILPHVNGVVSDNNPLPAGKPGLIFVRGEQIMKGYYKRPDLTSKIIDKEGWLNTGDIGLLTFDNEVKITGRAKDTIVLLDGENIEPAVIESELQTSEFIESAVVLGQDQKYLGALIVPSKTAIENWADTHGMTIKDYNSFIESVEITNLLLNEINHRVNPENGFRTCERIFRFEVIANSFKVGAELSAKQEIMRFKIVEKYHELIERMFA